MKSVVYKAQWPMATNEGQPMVLIYPDATREPWIQMPATEAVKQALFAGGKFVKVYFLGQIRDNAMEIEKFVRQSEWV